MSGDADLAVTLEFSGGAELLFDNQKRHEVALPARAEGWTLRGLLPWVGEHLLRQRRELFLQGDSVRPGIIVLVNDTDWELLGELDCRLRAGDTVAFISTLHGG